jgi:hypothetical protein
VANGEGGGADDGESGRVREGDEENDEGKEHQRRRREGRRRVRAGDGIRFAAGNAFCGGAQTRHVGRIGLNGNLNDIFVTLPT